MQADSGDSGRGSEAVTMQLKHRGRQTMAKDENKVYNSLSGILINLINPADIFPSSYFCFTVVLNRKLIKELNTSYSKIGHQV